MAKKKQRKGKAKAKPVEAAKPAVPAKAVEAPAELPEAIVYSETAPPPREPAFWFGFEVTWAKLAVSRFVLFMLLAADALFSVSHAPRYGAGGFNVPQFGFMETIAPDRVAYGTAQLLLAYGFVLVAFGVATRVVLPVCAAIYAWVYFGSQLDSYQHHYLVVMVLAIASFVPWQRPANATPGTLVRSWALRLLLVQLAVMYLWAAISKMNLAWVDGRTLSIQMTGGVEALITKTVGFKVASVIVILVELTLAATIWTRPGWKIAAPLGVLFHAGILFTGLEIGLFAFLMLGIYVLVIPDRWCVSAYPDSWSRALSKPSWFAWGIGVAASIGLALLVRMQGAFVIAIATLIVPLGVAVYAVARGHKMPRIAVGLAHLVAIALWVLVDRGTSTTTDYYKFWAGSERRLGTPERAEAAYRRYIAVAPDDELGHFYLGRLLIKRGAGPEGVEELREAERLAPAKARAFVEEARYLQSQSKTAEAIEKAKQATYADPSDAKARAYLDSLTGGKPVKPSADDDP